MGDPPARPGCAKRPVTDVGCPAQLRETPRCPRSSSAASKPSCPNQRLTWETCGGIPRTPKGRLRLSSPLVFPRPQTVIPGWKTRPREWAWLGLTGAEQWLGSLAGITVQKHWWDCWLSLSDKATKQTLPPGTGSTHILQDSVGAHSCVFVWGFPFPDNHPSRSLDLPVWFEAGRKTVKTANGQREGVMMDITGYSSGYCCHWRCPKGRSSGLGMGMVWRCCSTKASAGSGIWDSTS